MKYRKIKMLLTDVTLCHATVILRQTRTSVLWNTNAEYGQEMRSRQTSERFGQPRATIAQCFMLIALTQLMAHVIAFQPSPIALYRTDYSAEARIRGIHRSRNKNGFNIRDSHSHPHPIHVLRYSYRPQDNLFSGLAEIGMGFSIGVLYSEYFIIMTGCGPPNFGDTLERICYQGVIVYSGLALFIRIVTQFKSGLEDTLDNMYGPLQPATLWQVRIAEYLSATAVVGAIVALQVQYSKGVSMDGLSGIDINMCRAMLEKI